MTKRDTPHNECLLELEESINRMLGGKYSSLRDNNLPKKLEGERTTKDEVVYRPDIIICSKENPKEKKDIKYIIEVESGDTGGKTIAGATILADYCIGIHKENELQSEKITLTLFWVILGEKSTINRAKKRVDALKEGRYLKHIEVEFCARDEISDVLHEKEK